MTAAAEKIDYRTATVDEWGVLLDRAFESMIEDDEDNARDILCDIDEGTGPKKFKGSDVFDWIDFEGWEQEIVFDITCMERAEIKNINAYAKKLADRASEIKKQRYEKAKALIAQAMQALMGK